MEVKQPRIHRNNEQAPFLGYSSNVGIPRDQFSSPQPSRLRLLALISRPFRSETSLHFDPSSQPTQLLRYSGSPLPHLAS